jgi:hypothetical protein
VVDHRSRSKFVERLVGDPHRQAWSCHKGGPGRRLIGDRMPHGRPRQEEDMDLALWIVAGVLGTAFVAGGAVKMFIPRDKFASLGPASAWAGEFTPGSFTAIGVVEALGGLGMIVPAALGIAPILVPIAASSMALYMSGATTTRLRRGEFAALLGDLVFLGLCVFVAWGRFGPEPFGG